MLQWPDSPSWQALSKAVQPAISAAVPALERALQAPVCLPERVGVGAPDAGLWALDGAVLRLHPALAAEGVWWPGHQALLDAGLHAIALDRWRATIGAVLEACAVYTLGGCPADPVDASWLLGRAAHAVDTADPHLGWLRPSAVFLLTRPGDGLLQHPRAAAWWLRFCDRTDPSQPLPTTTPEAWTAFGRHIRDRSRGPSSALPVPVPPAAPIPWSPTVALAPWSHLPMKRGLAEAGRSWTVRGPVAPVQLEPSDAAGEVVFGTCTGGTLTLEARADGPVGSWRLDSGGMGGQVGSARGVSLTLRGGGAASLTAADGFVGPVARSALDMADQYGVSGSADGRWRLTGLSEDRLSGTLRVAGLHTGMATVHGRGGGGFALPAEEWLAPVRSFLQMLEPVPLSWRVHDGGQRLTLSAPTLAGLELRFSREA